MAASDAMLFKRRRGREEGWNGLGVTKTTLTPLLPRGQLSAMAFPVIYTDRANENEIMRMRQHKETNLRKACRGLRP